MNTLMKEVLERIPYWPVVTLILVLCILIIFRKEVAEVIGELQEFEFDPRNRRFRLIFNQEVKQAKARAQLVGKEVADNPTLPAGERVADFANESARDIVLQSWAALKQIVYDGCIANNLPLTPTTGVHEALRRLGEAKVLKPELDSVINLLAKMGAQLADNTRLRPSESDARQYKEVASDVIDWMMLNLIARPGAKSEQPLATPPRRPTAVGEYFPQPQSGRPAAVLNGTGGAVRAKQFPIERAYFRIGRDPNNEVRIAEDDFVSNHHASLRYQAGSLFLADEGSRNGTFLNDRRVTEAPVLVRRGDRIRIGNAIFQVSGAPPTPAVNKDKGRKQSEFVG